MSAAHHLTPPINLGKPVLALSVGLSLALLAFTATRSTLPHVGDTTHSLPHGGRYVDGTKRIDYFRPQPTHSNPTYPFVLLTILILSGLILLLSRRAHTTPRCPCCKQLH
uniref:Triple gene block 2 protein n=1 Tax=Viola mottle virus TaxID=2931830 RepID=A0A8T9JFJ8_9VIRU|nr:triple gene block 2 protein [Viola mottle virus]BCT36591.1 triple gene block protein 2 [Tulip virus X]